MCKLLHGFVWLALLGLGVATVCAQQPALPAAAVSCKQQADDFVYPPPKNAKEAKSRAQEEKLREKEDRGTDWTKVLGGRTSPDIGKIREMVKEHTLWDTKFDECLHNDVLGPGLKPINSPDGRVSVLLREGVGGLYVTMDATRRPKLLPLVPVVAKSGKLSDGLFKCKTPDHRTLFIYRDINGGIGREVVPVEGQDKSFLDKNGKFMVSIDANGGIIYVQVAAPSPAPPPNVEPTTDAAQPYQGARSGTLECTGAPVPQSAEYVFRDVPAVNLKLDYDKNVWEARLLPGDGKTQRLILTNKGKGPQKKCAVHWTVIEP